MSTEVTKELQNIIKIDNEYYRIIADKVANSLAITVNNGETASEITFNGSTAAELTIDIPTSLPAEGALTIKGGGEPAIAYDGAAAKSLDIKGSGATAVSADTNGNITISSTDTKVTSVDNHYDPVANTNKELTAAASSSTAATWNITNLVTGVNLQRDAKGHVTGVTVNSVKMPSNPSTVKYLGTVSTLNSLSTTAKAGDFYRVSEEFTFSGSEKAHVGDILIATKDNPSRNATDWDLIHTEVDSNTWIANSKDADGYVTKGLGQVNKVWKTDANGTPGWRDDNGLTGVQMNGNGNAFTLAGYDAETKVLTLTKQTVFATKAEVDSLISHGAADPDANTSSQYYFKY